jgi:hypothetical protein
VSNGETGEKRKNIQENSLCFTRISREQSSHVKYILVTAQEKPEVIPREWSDKSVA